MIGFEQQLNQVLQSQQQTTIQKPHFFGWGGGRMREIDESHIDPGVNRLHRCRIVIGGDMTLVQQQEGGGIKTKLGLQPYNFFKRLKLVNKQGDQILTKAVRFKKKIKHAYTRSMVNCMGRALRSVRSAVGQKVDEASLKAKGI